MELSANVHINSFLARALSLSLFCHEMKTSCAMSYIYMYTFYIPQIQDLKVIFWDEKWSKTALKGAPR